jgi:hypothetical protein
MTEPRLDPNDIAAGATAQGAAIIGWGTIVEATGDDRSTAAFVSEHERLHVNLNLGSAYGVLLRACAIHNPENLGAVVEMCRTTHETYATYLGIWVAEEEPAEVLARFPSYVRYFEHGQLLAREFRDGGIAARNAVSAAAHAAMQPQLPDLVPQMRDGVLSLPETSQPDPRFAALCEEAPEVRALLDSFPPDWLERPIEETLRTEHAAASRDEMTRLNRVLYEHYADVLRSRGFPTLSWNGQHEDESVIAISRLGGAGEEIPLSLNLGKDEDDPRNPSRLSLRVFDRERWVQSGSPSAALAVHLLDVPAEPPAGTVGPKHLIGDRPGESHVFIVVRPLEMLLAQYRLSEQSRRILSAAATKGVVTAVRRTVNLEGEPAALLAPLSSVSELQRLRGLDTDLGILTSVSFACLGIPEWRDYWLPSLHMSSELFLNCDIPLSHWLEATEAEEALSSLRFESQGAISDRTDTPTQILAVEYDVAEKVDTRQLILGSPTAIASLAFALASSPHVSAKQDREMLPSSQLWQRVISRLLDEEPWFDRRGFEYLDGEESE